LRPVGAWCRFNCSQVFIFQKLHFNRINPRGRRGTVQPADQQPSECVFAQVTVPARFSEGVYSPHQETLIQPVSSPDLPLAPRSSQSGNVSNAVGAPGIPHPFSDIFIFVSRSTVAVLPGAWRAPVPAPRPETCSLILGSVRAELSFWIRRSSRARSRRSCLERPRIDRSVGRRGGCLVAENPTGRGPSSR